MILALVLLLTSCYSYREIELGTDPLEYGDRLKLVSNQKKRKGKLQKISQDSITLKKNGHLKKYAITKDLKVRKGRFSALKSIGFPMVILGVGLYGIITFDGFSIDLGDGW